MVYRQDLTYLIFSPLETLTRGQPLIFTLFNLYISSYDTFIDDLSPHFNNNLLPMRYINSIIITTTLPYPLAIKIDQQIKSFISSSLKLPLEYNKIYYEPKTPVKFLNIYISILPSSPLLGKRKIKFKLTTKLVIGILNLLGFCDQQGRPSPHFTFYKAPYKSITSFYKQTIFFILSTFQPFDNFPYLTHKVQYIFKISFIKLLSAKLKLKSTRAVYKKHGKPPF